MRYEIDMRYRYVHWLGPDLHMMRLSSARGQWSRRASIAVSGMVAAVRRSDMARLTIRIFLGIISQISWLIDFKGNRKYDTNLVL